MRTIRYAYKKPHSMNENTLAIRRPDVTLQWHPTKNLLSPKEVTEFSNRLAHWICQGEHCNCGRKHEWDEKVCSRVRNSGICPYDSKSGSNKFCECKSFAVLFPIQAAQWDPIKNDRRPEEVLPGSMYKAHWRCNGGHCDCGVVHEWISKVLDRVNYKGICPFDSNKHLCVCQSLYAKEPQIASEWHPNRNGSLTPDKVAPTSRTKVWWYTKNTGCDCLFFEWEASISNRTYNRNGCPYLAERGSKLVCPCRSLAGVRPELAKEWHPTKNGDIRADQVHPGSHMKAWWYIKDTKCDCLFFEWEADVHNRVYGNNPCPFTTSFGVNIVCPCRSLARIRPDIAINWHPSRNGDLRSDQVSPVSNKTVWWYTEDTKCQCHHFEWEAKISDRTAYEKTSLCPIITERKGCCPCRSVAKKDSNVAKEWHQTKNELLPAEVHCHSTKYIWWLCELGHEWQAAVYSRTRAIQPTSCPICANSLGEKTVRLHLISRGFEHVHQTHTMTSMTFISQYKVMIDSLLHKLDFLICVETSKGIAFCVIEFDGLQHFEPIEYFKDTNESFEKRRAKDLSRNQYCFDHGVNMVRIRYFDVKKIPEILDDAIAHVKSANKPLLVVSEDYYD